MSNLKAHETSKCHSESFLMIFTLPNTSQNVGERLLSHLQQQRAEIQFCFLKKIEHSIFGFPRNGIER